MYQIHPYIKKINENIQHSQYEKTKLKQDIKINKKILRKCNNKIIDTIHDHDLQIKYIQYEMNNNNTL